MDHFITVPTVTWSAPQTWSVGSRGDYQTSNETGSFSNASATGTGTTGRTFTGSGSNGETSSGVTGFGPTGSTYDLGGTTNIINHEIESYIPSTGTVFVPSSTDGSGTTAATTSTITFNVTIDDSTAYETGVSLTTAEADTLSSYSSTSTGATSLNTANTTAGTGTSGSAQATLTQLQTTISSSSVTLGNSAVTTISTSGTFPFLATSTTSYSFSTGAGTSTGTASSWTTSAVTVSSESTQTVSGDTAQDITHQQDFSAINTAVTITRTAQQLTPLEDTVILQNADRAIDDYWLGNEVQVFSIGSLAATATTALRFSDIYSSVSSPTHTLSDFSRFQSMTAEVTGLSVSYNTVSMTTSVQTGASTSDSTTTGTTISTTYKNGLPWSPTNTGNTVTVTQTLSAGEVSTTTASFTHGSPVSTSTITQRYATIQTTGYDPDDVWESGTSTLELAFDSSYTETRLSLHASLSTTLGFFSFASQTEEILFSRFETTGTGPPVFVGHNKTTTTNFYGYETSTTVSLWDDRYNPEIEIWTTESTATSSNAGARTEYSKSQSIAATYHTEQRVLPEVWTYPSGLFDTPFTQTGQQIWYSAPAAGFGGFGGNFDATSLPVYLTVQIGLISGGAFGSSQTLGTTNLPTALAYDAVTFFPARTDFPDNGPNGAAGMSYVSRLSTLGQAASIAVTWTSTTTSSGTGAASTGTTSTGATYTLAGVSSITGNIFRSAPITVNTNDVRGDLLNFGGYVGGDHALDHEYTVRVGYGYAAWTEADSVSTTSSSSSTTKGSMSFTVAGDRAIVISAEPIYTVQWKPEGDLPFVSSVPHFPS